MLFEDLLNEKLNLSYKFKVKSADYDRKSLTLSLSLYYPDSVILTSSERNRVDEIALSVFDKIKEIKINYIKNYFDETILKEDLTNYVTQNFSCALISKFDYDENLKSIYFEFDNLYSAVIDKEKFCDLIQNYLLSKYDTKFNISLEFVDVQEDIIVNEPKFVSLGEVKTTYHVDDRVLLIGEAFEDDPIMISSIKGQMSDVVVAGIVTRIIECETKPKTDSEGKIKEPKKYYKFAIQDFSGELNCVYFPNQTNLPKMEKIKKDSHLIICGNAEESKFSSGIDFKPKNIMITNLPSDFLTKVIRKSVPKAYRYIKPEEFISRAQVGFFDSGNTIINDYLINNEIVVFDFETTGLDGQNDRIIEIGAVKIKKGIITETFSCMVNPKMHIPDESSAVHHIYDEDVIDAHTIEEVIPDFYKFCFGCVLVAYNIDFDYKFLSIAGKNNGYIFDNPQLDALKLAKTALVGKLKVFKLIKVAEYLHVSLENAHRAVHDAIATAEVFIKLADYIEKIL